MHLASDDDILTTRLDLLQHATPVSPGIPRCVLVAPTLDTVVHPAISHAASTHMVESFKHSITRRALIRPPLSGENHFRKRRRLLGEGLSRRKKPGGFSIKQTLMKAAQ